MSILQAIQKDYQEQLKQANIPLDPNSRTDDQQSTAATIYWAVLFEVSSFQLITQTSLEK